MIRLGLTGYSLGHSLSPLIHAAALRVCGLEGDYSLFPVPPDDRRGLQVLLERLRTGELTGLNVTIPHKQHVIPYLDKLSPTARVIGAVNTVYREDDCLCGDNTDAPAFLADLRHFLFEHGVDARSQSRQDTKKTKNLETSPLRAFMVDKKALALGAGGAARAVAWALFNDGWRVTVAARRVEQAEALVKDLGTGAGPGWLEPAPWEPGTLERCGNGTQLIVNATPIGMSPKSGFSPWEGLPFPAGAAVYDLVYNPRQTLLVEQARRAGLHATTGLGMLVEQAALAFEIWTGRRVPHEVLFSAVEASC